MARRRAPAPARRRAASRAAGPVAACAVALVCLLATRVARAGDPDLDWWTLETTHFRVHYERGLEPVARRIATLGETIHQRLVAPLGYDPDGVTEVVLTDDTDSANGFATSLPFNSVHLFVTAPSDLSALGDHDDWHLGLLTHEYTHILHVDDISGLPTVVNRLLGKLWAPNQMQPRWILEGLATVVETLYTSGGRVRSNLFDMYLRADVLEDNFAGLDQISSNVQRWPNGNLFYLYGSRFLGWIRDVYGPDTLRAVAVDYGESPIPWGINRSIRRATGMTYPELYEGFHEHLARRYGAQIAAAEARGLREGTRLTFDGRNASYPAFAPAAARRALAPSGAASPDGYDLFYYRDDGFHPAGHHRLRLERSIEAGTPGPLRPSGEPELVARSDADSPITFLRDGSLVFAGLPPWRNLYRRPDLFVLGPGERTDSAQESARRQLTDGLRAIAPSASPDGRHLAYTVNHQGTTTLEMATLDASGALAERRLVAAHEAFDQAYTPAFSPDGKHLAYSAWTRGGYRDIRIVDLEAQSYVTLGRDRALDTGPCWSPDGGTLYFSSDRSGIYNVYAYELASRRLRQVTNVRTGAFMPAVSGDGRLLAYVGYGAKGYDLYLMPLDPTRFLEPAPVVDVHPTPREEPAPVSFERHRYDPWPTLRPHSFVPWNFAPGAFGGLAWTVTTSMSDVVGHHDLGLSLTVEGKAPGPQAQIDYTYHRLPVDLGVRLGWRYARRTDYRIADQKPPYVERSISVRPSVSLPILGELASQRVTASYTASVLDSDLPVRSVSPDPYASATALPPRGYFGVASLDYGVSSVERSLDTAGPTRGMSLGLGLDYASDATGAFESLYSFSWNGTAYVPMPWPGHHTLALRSAGGLSAGSYSRRSVFSVGGYDLERNSLLDELTKGVFNGSFALRGYPAGAYSGAMYTLSNLEYRMPLVDLDHGVSTLPVFLRRVSSNLFLDYGGAFNQIDFHGVRFFRKGSIIDAPMLHTAVGAELWLETTLAYAVDLQFRVGYAYGFSNEAFSRGQVYFVASSPF
ncbi:MAG: PD40 domain-containing protein [Polyangiaceae bacterium]|nr:PD40 domain-containing protein [Polyangiaceae bacterium]